MRDQDGFSALFQRHFERVTRLLSRKGRLPEDAEDLAQETFFRAWRDLGDQLPDNENAYLNTIARNTSANDHRDSTAQKRAAKLVELDETLEDPHSSEERLIARLRLAPFFAAVAEVMESLPPVTQQCIVLRGRGLKGAEIAELLDMRHTAVRSRLTAANEKFVEKLGPPPDGFDWLELAGAQR